MTTKTIYLPTLYIDEETGEILEKNSLKNLTFKTITNEINTEKNGTIKRGQVMVTIVSNGIKKYTTQHSKN